MKAGGLTSVVSADKKPSGQIKPSTGAAKDIAKAPVASSDKIRPQTAVPEKKDEKKVTAPSNVS